MKTILRISFVIVLLCLFAMPVQAQDDKNYEYGSVWQVSYYKIKPGQLDNYMEYLSKGWKMTMDEYVKGGEILSYKILDVFWAMDNEPNFIILTEAKNWATLDIWDEYSVKVEKKIEKMLKKDGKEEVDRDAMREYRGALISQEMLIR